MSRTPDDYDLEIKQLAKELRILKKQLERSEKDRIRLENTNRTKESLLKRVICELQESQSILERKSTDLEQAVTKLTAMQTELVEAEKMAALGGLVAGVAHEINTPVGVSITMASTLMDETQKLMQAVAAGPLRRSLLDHYLLIAEESTSLILNNLNRAGELVQSFKQVAVDQTIAEKRRFAVKPYLEEVVTSLSPQIKHTGHSLTVTGDNSVVLSSYPGALAQVATNLVTNSLTHAYPCEARGHLRFDVSQHQDQVVVNYSDDGCGIPEAIIGKIFDPFFTTARDKGGSGLGLHIAYNLVMQRLQGQIEIRSVEGQGTEFTLLLPISVHSQSQV
ncbi:ATP-binding protein [Nodosilinea sp. E11]|uniref:ATP-binding protein n=1 Tax=Nodosilinea sp. E11 TaxID=3037479 RepID=UPI0029350001|nr:ATP-binding protein [Nodosilinea sp. E11]WOD41523.1 ATP-binding protein [Nodosilinea sp. E11]